MKQVGTGAQHVVVLTTGSVEADSALPTVDLTEMGRKTVSSEPPAQPIEEVKQVEKEVAPAEPPKDEPVASQPVEMATMKVGTDALSEQAQSQSLKVPAEKALSQRS